MGIQNMMTVSEAAKKFGVCNQRMHQLIKAYGVKTLTVHSRLKLIETKELAKIPKNRPDGVHIEKR